MNAAPSILIGHVVETLPTDIRKRREVLNALIEILSPGSVPPDLRTLLGDLDRHLICQRELALGFPSPSRRGSGRLGDHPLERGSGRMGDDSRERGIAKGGRR